MADLNPVRLVGVVEDIDGYKLAVGVDHDTVTFGTEHAPGAWARFNREQRNTLWRLWQDAIIAVAEHEREVKEEWTSQRST